MDPVTLVQQALLTSLVLAAKIPVDMDELIAFEETGTHRFELMTRMANKIDVRPNFKTEWLEHPVYPNVMITTGASGGTTIPVDNPGYAHTDQTIYNMDTDEQYLMNEDIGGGSTAGSITVVNHTGSGSITTATVAGQRLVILPESHAEGEAIPDPFTSKAVTKFTYIMQSTETLKYSDRAQHQNEYGLMQYLGDLKQKHITRQRGKNLSLLISKQVLDITSASGPRRYTSQGLREAVVTNKIDLSGPGGSGQLNLSVIGALLDVTTRATSSSATKVGFAGQNAMTSLSALANDAVRTTVHETLWGKKLMAVRTPFGDLAFDHDRALTDQYGLADVFIISDMKTMVRLQAQGLPERMIFNTGNASDIHNVTTALTGTWGLKVKWEYLNAWINGIS